MGQFQGVIIPMTPIGSRRTIVRELWGQLLRLEKRLV
jgi:hypothetical protein